MELAQAGDLMNRSTNRKRLGMRNFSNDLKVHQAPICCRLTLRLSRKRRRAKPARACRLEALVMRHDER
jgi:hypothetical protein